MAVFLAVTLPVFLLATLLVVLPRVLRERRRREALADLARKLGWRFSPRHNKRFESRFPQFECFRRGTTQNAWVTRSAYNTLSGRLPTGVGELECLAGDYRYQVKSGSVSKRTSGVEHFSFLLVKSPGTAVGELSMRPGRLRDKLGAAAGFGDIRFESIEFNERFHVTGSDKRFAYDLIHPRVIVYLLDSNSTPPFVLSSGWLCVVRYGHRWDASGFRSRVEWAAGFFSHWPTHLLGSETAAGQTNKR